MILYKNENCIFTGFSDDEINFTVFPMLNDKMKTTKAIVVQNLENVPGITINGPS